MNELLNQETAKYLHFDPISEQIGAKPEFGRLIVVDERNIAYPMKAMLDRSQKKTKAARTARKWRKRWQGDQKQTSQCTAYSFLHLFEHEPVNHPRSYGKYKGFPRPIVNPRDLYCRAQQIDPWPGGCGATDSKDAYDGTSILAMMHVAREYGFIDSFAWEYRNIDTILETVITRSPVILGTNWYNGMELSNNLKPEEAVLEPTGRVVGGHAYLIDEVDLRPKRKGREIGIFNSWGEQWGYGGRAYMSLETLEKLLLEPGGEAVIVEETP